MVLGDISDVTRRYLPSRHAIPRSQTLILIVLCSCNRPPNFSLNFAEFHGPLPAEPSAWNRARVFQGSGIWANRVAEYGIRS